MTHAIDSMMLPEVALPARVDLPHLPGWAVPRRRLADRLELGLSGVVTLVSAPAGWGKTLGVASWAANASLPGGLIWLKTAGAAQDPDLFWKLVHDGLVEAGERQLVPVPTVRSQESLRVQALAQFGAALRRSGPWLLVLDDFPTGQVGDLGRELEIVMDQAQRALSLVVLSHGQPALAVHRHHVAGDLTKITVPDLAMDRREVAAVLARHEVDSHEFTARTVQRHTAGWACGVRFVADALRAAPTIEAAIEEADRSTVDYLASEVLAKSSDAVRDLIVQTSSVEEVTPDLARAVLGSGAADVFAPEVADDAFIELRRDGSFRCHPLLRAAASRELAREPIQVGREARRRAAQWQLDRGDTSVGLEIAMAAQDWSWVGRALVATYVVPRILEGSNSEVAQSALAIAAVREDEPLIEAALLLSRGGPDAASAVLGLVGERATAGQNTVADELSAIFVRLAVARARGDADTGLPLATRARELMAHLPIDRQRELFTMLEAHVGALELCSGEVDRAEVTLRHGAVGAPGENQTSTAPLDCLGQLALLEAFRGNLRQADRQAAAVLKSAGHARWTGVAHAHLATAWVHLERGEHVPARQHLDRAAEVGTDAVEPWYGTAQLLAEARLLVVTDQPEAALRLLSPAMHTGQQAGQRSAWASDLLVLEAANALLATGEPGLALELLSQDAATSPVESGLVAAKARAELGDAAGARAAIVSVAAQLPGASLATQIESWLLEAKLAEEPERARALVDRALREGARELMRRQVARETAWVLPLVDADPALRRSHGGFLAGLRSPTYGLASRSPGSVRLAPELIETLTVREAQVLGLLADMCSTEEIAAELFLSVNTVKTYVRGILRKLSVNRRVDAVRRGRELGLC